MESGIQADLGALRLRKGEGVEEMELHGRRGMKDNTS
jgi:hypothetical protein